jgi:hypothetical protein
MTPVAPLITDFLREHMPRQRGYSPLSCESYAHGFKLLFAFAAKRLHTRPSQLSSSISKLTWCSRSCPALSRIAATAPRPAICGSQRSRRSCDTSSSNAPVHWSKSRGSTPSRVSVTTRNSSAI